MTICYRCGITLISDTEYCRDCKKQLNRFVMMALQAERADMLSVKQIEEIKLTPNNCDKCDGELDSNRDCRNYCSDEIELTPNNKE